MRRAWLYLRHALHNRLTGEIIMLPEVLHHIIKSLEAKRAYAESQFQVVSTLDKGYYAGMCSAYTLALALLKNGPEQHEDMS